MTRDRLVDLVIERTACFERNWKRARRWSHHTLHWPTIWRKNLGKPKKKDKFSTEPALGNAASRRAGVLYSRGFME